MRIDSHQHVFWHHRDDAGLIADMDDNDVDLAWLLTWEITPGDPLAPSYLSVLNPLHALPDGRHRGIPLEDLLRARDRYPDRFLIGYCPDPRLPHAPELLNSAAGIYDVRICGEWKFQLLFDDPRCLNLYRRAGELGMPVVLHLDVPFLPDADTGKPTYQPHWYGGSVDHLERALQACPDTAFIGHAPGFWRCISGDEATASSSYPGGPVTPGGRLYELFDRYENLYADLSAGSGLRALNRDPQHAQRFLTRYADRLLWGRDFYGSDLPDFLATVELKQPVRDRIEHQNASKLVDTTP